MDINEERLLFYLELGYSISAWADVELSLWWVLSAAFEDRDYDLHASEFFSVENFRTKLQMVDTAISVKFKGSQHHEDWAELFLRCTALAKHRNKLAHYWVLNNASPRAREGRRIMLLPRLMKPGAKEPKIPQKFAGAIYVADIIVCGWEFSTLSNALQNLRQRIFGKPERFPKSLERAPDRPTIRHLNARIRGHMLRPPKPSRR